MPVFYFLIILAAAVSWLLLSRIYRPLGRLAHRIWQDAKDNMDDKPDAPAASENDSQITHKGDQ